MIESRFARASWIEISIMFRNYFNGNVEVRKSLVDRNTSTPGEIQDLGGRGSQEPRGSKSYFLRRFDAWLGRGSQEPRGSKSFDSASPKNALMSRFARASWIEIAWRSTWRLSTRVEVRKSLVDRNLQQIDYVKTAPGRGSQEPRGSKYFVSMLFFSISASRFARASWIEIGNHLHDPAGKVESRFARASWIEIVPRDRHNQRNMCRGSQEPRGSKWRAGLRAGCRRWSRFARASWIEIICGIWMRAPN